MKFALDIKKPYLYKIVVVWALVLSLLVFHQTFHGSIISISYFPAFPRSGEPFQVTIKLINPDQEAKIFALKIYMNGLAIADWFTRVEGSSIKEYSIADLGSFNVGESIRIHVDVNDIKSGKLYSCSQMIPPFPPEAFTSFISFASFSSTLMGYITTLSYYTTTITPSEGINAGLILSLTLISLLIFIELTDPAYGRIGDRIKHLRRNFTREAIILLSIFLAMVATKIVFIIYGV
ncbi:MAG: hypothetical protein QXE73_00045 [Candidatus Bathyarchaeia archaeon]